ncbi:NAD(P)H-hydrate dehydratase [Peribacillus sp. FSL H8-0477]|uniref:NAD(P)H-hydrate dehydratase n=1 Tax=Peribacillus sp. FSL H8-0477 TaxID=2921388 RepID=UPI0030FA1B27
MYIYKSEDIKKVDAEAAKKGLDSFTLMENAGSALYRELSSIVNKEQRLLILAGKGNNGGDGIVLARYLKQNGYRCDLVFPDETPITPSAQRHFTYFSNCGFEVSHLVGSYDVIIDALLGAGARHPIQKNMLQMVSWANTQDALRIAIDMPTGVIADKGEVEAAFRADYTYSLHGYKPSAFLEGSEEYYGEISVLDIGLPHTSNWRIWTESDVKRTFTKRNPNAHKGTYGTGLLVAGTDEMPGSALLAALAAMRSGIGKLTVATNPFASAIIAAKVPECTFIHNGLEQLADGQIPQKINATAIGPGLTDQVKIDKALKHLFEEKIPLILDAGALTMREYPRKTAPIVVTPHPGEFAKMTGEMTADIQKNRLDEASAYAIGNEVIVVLKGRNTVIAFPDGSLHINVTGNAGLAKGGTGDTLTGILLAFISSANDIKSAIANAVYLHGASAEYWSETRAETSLLASDVSENLAFVLKAFE